MRALFSFLLSILLSFPCQSQTQVREDFNPGNSPAGETLKTALAQYNSGDRKSAEQNLRKAAELARTEKNDKLLLHATQDLGSLLADVGRYAEAMQEFQAALQLARANKMLTAEAKILKDIGALYVARKQYKEGLDYYDQAEKMALTTRDWRLVADCYNNKGIVYEQQNNFAGAAAVYGKALKYYEQAGDVESQAMTLSNLALVYKGLGKIDEAITYNLKSLALSRNTNDWMAAATLGNISNAYGQRGNYEEALRYGNESVALARKIDAPEIVFNALESLADAADKAGNHKEALRWHRAFAAAKDSFLNTQNSSQLAELQVRFETAEKERALAESKALAARNANAVQRQRGVIWGGGAGFLLLAAVGVLGFRNTRLRRIHDVQAAQLEAVKARQQMQDERLRIGRELHDNIGSQLTLVSSSLQGGNTTPERLQEAGALTLQAIRDLRSTVWFINHDSCTAEELAVKLREYLRPASNSGVQVTVELLGGAALLSSKASTHLLRIVQEAVNNALKYSTAKAITVTLDDRETDCLRVQVADNGKGFDPATLSEGFGLQNMKSRAGELGGNYQLTSAPGKGTQISVTVPLPA